jgi:DNA polymerase V
MEEVDMGFPSPARDYIERRLSPDIICGIDSNSLIIETSSGFAVVDISKKSGRASIFLINFEGRNQFAKIMGRALITDDGEAIEDESLDEVNVIGEVTFFINRAGVPGDDELPVL